MDIKDIPVHDKIVLKMGVYLFEHKVNDIQQLGDKLLEMGSDELTNGGYWIWDYNTNEVYYSPLFCTSLGFDYGDFGTSLEGFYNSDEEMLSKGMKMIGKLIDEHSHGCFVNDVIYYSKDDKEVMVECSGTVFYKEDKPIYVLGTHKIR